MSGTKEPTTPPPSTSELNRRMGLATGWRGDEALPGVCIPLNALVAALEAQAGRDYVPGLPPLRLRKAWAQWENGQVLPDGSVQVETFSHVGEPRECVHAEGWPDALAVSEADFSRARYRPHGKPWKEVEALAAELERQCRAMGVPLSYARAVEWSDDDLRNMQPMPVTAEVVRAFRDAYGVGMTEAKEALDARHGVELLALEYCHRKGTGTEHRAPLWERWLRLREKA